MTMKPLAQRHCVPCKGGVPPLEPDRVAEYLQEVDGWEASPGSRRIQKAFKFPDFKAALAFTNKVGEVAESEGHHPDVHLAYGEVRVEIWTHKIDGLTESDFVLAARIDAVPARDA
jgi:4a-hydroxytetrahydrobiopterin dehydratase